MLKRLRNFIYYRVYISRAVEKDIVTRFHKLYYDSHIFDKTWSKTFWLGVPTQKCPLDLWIYQEIIFSIKPDVIIECGTYKGGSALFLASVCDSISKGIVVTIDIDQKKERPKHKRINYLEGSSIDKNIVERVKHLIRNAKTVMVILDSDHSRDHVLQELRIYADFVTKESYLIVEDTNLNGHPVVPGNGPGPMEAVRAFLQDNTSFVVDRSKEKFYMTFNPGGYLKRIK